jgi:hypothetical protein
MPLSEFFIKCFSVGSSRAKKSVAVTNQIIQYIETQIKLMDTLSSLSAPMPASLGRFAFKSVLSSNIKNKPRSRSRVILGKGEVMAFIRKRRIWWEPVPEATSYVVYVSRDPAHFEPNHFLWEATAGMISKPVGGKTELIIPDEWPEFPTEPGTYYIGITSKDEVGNQSDPFVFSGQLKFLAPPSPSRGGIESL